MPHTNSQLRAVQEDNEKQDFNFASTIETPDPCLNLYHLKVENAGGELSKEEHAEAAVYFLGQIHNLFTLLRAASYDFFSDGNSVNLTTCVNSVGELGQMLEGCAAASVAAMENDLEKSPN